MGGVNGCGPQMSQAQNIQSAKSLEGPPSAKDVEAKQMANMAKMLEIQGKMQKGEISPEEGQKQQLALVAENAKLQASLAPGASAPASGTSGSSAGQGFSSKDSFEPAPAGKPVLMLSSPPPPPLDPSFLEKGGGGSKPGIIKAS